MCGQFYKAEIMKTATQSLKDITIILFVSGLIYTTASMAQVEQATEATAAGVVPLRGLLAVVTEKHPGQVLNVELEHDENANSDTWIYEVKMLTRKGRVYMLEYDAITLEPIYVEGNRYRRYKHHN